MAETVFQGTSALSLDGKGRITIPIRQRDLLLGASEGQLTLTKQLGGFLLVFPRPRWEAFRARLLTMPMSQDPFRRLYLGSAVDVELDSAARVLVPPELREYATLQRDVLLIGNGHLLELWDAGRHQAHEAMLTTQPLPTELQEFVL